MVEFDIEYNRVAAINRTFKVGNLITFHGFEKYIYLVTELQPDGHLQTVKLLAENKIITANHQGWSEGIFISEGSELELAVYGR